jgi:predicted transposase/invertase (TIGR01784 family)
MSEIQNPHDQFVRSTLSDKTIAMSFLENYLPSEIVEKLDFSKLEVSQESVVDEDLQENQTDLLYKISAKSGEKVFVYVLLEHKSAPEKRVAFQLLRYLVRIWEKHKLASKFPQIVPLVLYHGKRKWNVNREFAALVEFGKDKVYAKSTPNFEYFICDLSKFDENELKGEIALRIILLLLKHIFSPNLKHELVGILRLFAEIPEKGVVELFGKMLRYLSASSGKISRNEVKIAM